MALIDGPGGGRSLDLADHIEEPCAAGGTGLVWHAGDAISPPFMDDVLTQQGFEKTEDQDLDVLAFELGTDPEPKLPDLRVPNNVSTRPVRGEEDLRLVNVVEAGVIPASTWGKADTRLHARALGTRRRQRRGLDVEGVACALRYLALVRNRRGEGQEVAGTASAELTGKTARLWGAGTFAGHRGWGAYRVLVMERCRHAHALGATLALTKANIAPPAPILRNAGFHSVASERRYALKMVAQASRRV